VTWQPAAVMNSMHSDAHLAERRRMVDEKIRARGLTDSRVLAAMEEVPRELFVRGAELAEALSDRALPIDCGQTISQPYMVAAMTELLKLQPERRVLEIGTGCGYQTAVLARLAGHVFTIERLADLQAGARRLLTSLDVNNVSYHVGDGTQGWPYEAPFDGIIVTAAAHEIPPPLLAQLADGGRLVIPVGGEHEQILTVVEREQGRLHENPQFPCRFVKLIGRAGWDEPPMSEPTRA